MGAVAGGIVGAAAAISYHHNPAVLGAIGAGEGAMLGDITSKLRQNKEYAKDHGSRFPRFKALNPITGLRMLKNTSAKENLKQGDPFSMPVGAVMRKFKLKDQK